MVLIVVGDHLILICLLRAASMAHFNAPKFYKMELQNNSLNRHHNNTVVAPSFGTFSSILLVLAIVTVLGFLTLFGASCLFGLGFNQPSLLV